MESRALSHVHPFPKISSPVPLSVAAVSDRRLHIQQQLYPINISAQRSTTAQLFFFLSCRYHSIVSSFIACESTVSAAWSWVLHSDLVGASPFDVFQNCSHTEPARFAPACILKRSQIGLQCDRSRTAAVPCFNFLQVKQQRNCPNCFLSVLCCTSQMPQYMNHHHSNSVKHSFVSALLQATVFTQ